MLWMYIHDFSKLQSDYSLVQKNLEQRSEEALQLKDSLTETSRELEDKLERLEHITNRSEGQLTRIQELLGCKETPQESKRLLSDKLTESTNQISELTNKVKHLEAQSLEHVAEMKVRTNEIDMINGNLENLIDYIRRLEEELAAHGHSISEGPEINIPDVQEAWVEPIIRFNCPHVREVGELKNKLDTMKQELSSVNLSKDALSSKLHNTENALMTANYQIENLSRKLTESSVPNHQGLFKRLVGQSVQVPNAPTATVPSEQF